MGEYEQQFVTEAFSSNWIAPIGPHTTAFERELAEYVQVSSAVALNSGTAALHLALRLIGVSTGDVVFCSSFTFVASANPILYQGAEPVFIDSEPESWNMSPESLHRALEDAASEGRLPKAVIIVNLYGQSADMTPLKTLCDQYHVPIIEDAAESLGALYQGKPSGTLGKYGIYSFNGNKIITTSGGGMLVSNDMVAIAKARFWATQARDEEIHYQHTEMGYNYRLSNVLAGIGRGQLRVLEDRIHARREVFRRYFEALAHIDGVSFMPEANYGRSTRWITALTIDPALCGTSHFEVIDSLAKENIESRPLWKPMHKQPLFSAFRYYPFRDYLSVSESLYAQGICLPSGSNLSVEDQDRVIHCILKCLTPASTSLR